MIVAPAVDLREGRCVQLVGGRPEDERVSLPDPTAQALRWRDAGFGTLHVVDLDAALSLGNNRRAIRQIVEATSATVQVGGGVRTARDVDELLELGAERVVVGTRALEDPEWLEAASQARPGRIVVAADIKDGVVLKKGWTESSGLPVLELLTRLDPLSLAGVLCTDVGREGRMEGSDVSSSSQVIQGTRHPVWVSGGISTLGELRALAEAGAHGAVLGMALYTDTLPTAEVAEEFGS